MRLFGTRSLSWVLRWVADATLLLWLALFVWVMFIMIGQHMPEGSHGQQATITVDVKLPVEMVETTTSEVSVYNFESVKSLIHFRTTRDDLVAAALRFSGTIIGFGLFAWIVWYIRQILASLVAEAPLTSQNARRFRTIGVLVLAGALYKPLESALGYLHVQPYFGLLPDLGFLSLYSGDFEPSKVFLGFLVVLMAEVLRVGAEHRVDSESVV